MRRNVEFKVVILGDSAVGKTCLVQRFATNTFTNPDMTIGASFITRTLETDSGPANLSVWDTAGQERYRSLIPTYARGCQAALIAFDLSDRQTFSRLDYWVDLLRQFCPVDLPVWIVGTKLDLDPDVTDEEVHAYTAKHRFKYRATSAKLNRGVADLFSDVVKDLVENFPLAVERSPAPSPRQQESGCC